MKHIKKSGIVMVLILVTALCIGCGSKVNEEKSNPSTENHSSQVEEVILSILVDTFSSRILNPMLLPSGKRNIVVF